MVEVGIAEYFSIGEALGIIGTMFIVLYFSRKQMQSLSVDIETKILNDLDEKIHGLTRMAVERPELTKLISNVESDWSAEVAYTYHILYIFSHVYHLRQRKVVSDNEWTGWLRMMRTCFEEGKISEYWRSDLELEKWFDPAFEEFINKELIPMVKK
jgi:hypothetical protein